MKRDEWTLLAINQGGQKGLTPAQLQKVLFLFKKAFPSLTSFYDFTPYNYGPFDKDIYKDAEDHAENKLVKFKNLDGQSWSIYCITEEGKQKADSLAKTVDAKKLKYLATIIEWAQSLSFEQLITSIYEKYPEYRVNSVFRG